MKTLSFAASLVALIATGAVAAESKAEVVKSGSYELTLPPPRLGTPHAWASWVAMVWIGDGTWLIYPPVRGSMSEAMIE